MRKKSKKTEGKRKKPAKAGGGPSFTPDIAPKPEERVSGEQLVGREHRHGAAAYNVMEHERRHIGPGVENYGALKKPRHTEREGRPIS